MTDSFLMPEWPLPSGVHALVTTRQGGASEACYASFNLGLHVEDSPEPVRENRLKLQEYLGSSISIQWLKQVHEAGVYRVRETVCEDAPAADAIYTDQSGIACAILTADCLPVCFCSNDGQEIAIAHAGWRGLQAGVLHNTLRSFSTPAERIRVWLGPAIGPCHYEVGDDVRDSLLLNEGAGRAPLSAFTASSANAGRWMADLYAIAVHQLRNAGVGQISGAGLCTFCAEKTFYSYRRQPRCGRFATLIYKS